MTSDCLIIGDVYDDVITESYIKVLEIKSTEGNDLRKCHLRRWRVLFL